MKNKKYYIALNDREYAEIISSLINKRNSLIRLGKYTDGVDEVIMKVRKAKNRNFQILYHEENVDLLPANLELSAMEMMLVTTMSRETVLRTYLNKVKNDYESEL